MIKPLAATLLLLAIAIAPARAQLRLEGLERIYFTRSAEPGGELRAAGDLASLLPPFLAGPGSAQTVPEGIGEDGDVTVKDIELPSRVHGRRIWIRELSSARHPRMSEVWWALYDGGRRSDVWFFIPLPDRTDGKVLSNYRLDSISMPANDVMLLRVRGEMFRPGGAWWIVGKELAFTAGDSALSLERVRNAFGFFQSYDTDERPGLMSISTEREIDGRYEIRTVDSLSEGVPTGCLADTFPDDHGGYPWARLEEMAQCIIGQHRATVTSRDFDSPSFIERPVTTDAGTR